MPSQARTVQELLQEANQLSPKEQLQLATQLLLLVDQQLDSPMTDKALTEEQSVSITFLRDDDEIQSQEGRIDYLLAHPIPGRNFKPMSRDEIYDRR